jgi:hypothetical protein
MNIEFLAIIVGAGVGLVLLAVLWELVVLRSLVNRSTAAVKDLVADALEHETMVRMATPGSAVVEAVQPDQFLVDTAAGVVPGATIAPIRERAADSSPAVAHTAVERTTAEDHSTPVAAVEPAEPQPEPPPPPKNPIEVTAPAAAAPSSKQVAAVPELPAPLQSAPSGVTPTISEPADSVSRTMTGPAEPQPEPPSPPKNPMEVTAPAAVAPPPKQAAAAPELLAPQQSAPAAVTPTISEAADAVSRTMTGPAATAQPATATAEKPDAARNPAKAMNEDERAARRALRRQRREEATAGRAAAHGAESKVRPGLKQRPDESDEAFVARRERLLSRVNKTQIPPRRPQETDEEFAARKSRWQQKLKRLRQKGAASGGVARPKASRRQPNETDEQFAARRERIRQLRQARSPEGTSKE